MQHFFHKDKPLSKQQQMSRKITQKGKKNLIKRKKKKRFNRAQKENDLQI